MCITISNKINEIQIYVRFVLEIEWNWKYFPSETSRYLYIKCKKIQRWENNRFENRQFYNIFQRPNFISKMKKKNAIDKKRNVNIDLDY